MRKVILLMFFWAFLKLSFAQTYTWTGNAPIRDLQTDTIPLTISGMTSVIDTNYGIAHVCVNITHTYKSDLVINLISPAGMNVTLIQGIGGSADNFVGTCLGMDGTHFENASAPYTGIFVPVGDISSFNNNQNPNGVWRLLVRDAANADTGHVSSFSIEFVNNPPRAGNPPIVVVPSAVYTCPTCVCPGGAAACDLLPDVTASAKEIQLNRSEVPGALDISNATPNIGYGPIEIYGIDSCYCGGTLVPCNTICPDGEDIKHVIKQRIYQKRAGTDTLSYYDRVAGAMTYHAAHSHLHVDDWSSYTLRTATSNPDATTWPVVGTGVKQSFCLVNLGNCASNAGECLDNNGNPLTTFANHNFGFHTGCGMTQGIYPGNYDVYSMGLNEPIPLVNVCDGNYYVVSITDPLNNFIESDETNNWVAVPVTLTKQNLTPIVTVTGNTTICPGDSVVLTASNAVNLQWSNGQSGNRIVVRTAGTYTVTNTCGGAVSTPVVISSLETSGIQVGVSIAVTSGVNPGCVNDPITFTATATNGGTAPSYQWMVNGVATGTNSQTLTLSNHISGQTVNCQITSSISCLQNRNASSNTITIQTSNGQMPNVSITQTSGSNPICAMDTAIFSAAITYGNALSYQWKRNGVNVGGNSSVYSATNFAQGDSVTCVVNTIPACGNRYALGNSTTQNSVTSNVGSAYPTYYGNGRQQYLILASELSASGVTAGYLRSLSFNVGSSVGNPDTLKSYTIKLANTTVTSLTRAFQTPALTTVFGPLHYKPTINSINTHFFTTPYYWNGTSNILVDICFTNGVYGSRAYQTNYSTTSYTSTGYFQQDYPAGMIACTKDSGTNITSIRPNMLFGKDTPVVVNSNKLIMQRLVPPTAGITIQASTGNDTICASQLMNFTASVINPGLSNTFQWYKNGLPLSGQTNAVYTAAGWNNNDVVFCSLNYLNTCRISGQANSNQKLVSVADSLYTFTGTGNWSNASNWTNGKKPPSRLPSCSQIFINPSGAGECILSGQQTILQGARITVGQNKKLTIPGNLIMQ